MYMSEGIVEEQSARATTMVEAYYIINGQKIFLHSFGDMPPSRPRKSEADFGCALLACHFTRNAPKANGINMSGRRSLLITI